MDDYKKKSSIKTYLLFLICSIILVFIDQISKHYIIKNLHLHQSIPIIDNVFEIHYLRNPGAAWGIFENQQLFFCVSSFIVILIGISIINHCIKANRFKDIQLLLVLILSGAIGNMIDRLRFQYVIDFLYFKLINFPVFNIADCYVTIGVFTTIFLLIFKYNDQDIELMLHVSRKKNNKNN